MPAGPLVWEPQAAGPRRREQRARPARPAGPTPATVQAGEPREAGGAGAGHRGRRSAGQGGRPRPAPPGHGRRPRLRRRRRAGQGHRQPLRGDRAGPGPPRGPRRPGLPHPGRPGRPGPDPDADRRRHGRGPGPGAGPGRRRLPRQAVFVQRAGRAGAGAGAAQRRADPAGAGPRRPGAGPGQAPGQPRRALFAADPQGAGGAGGAAGRRGAGGLQRGAAGAGLGRARRPVHQHRAGHPRQPAPQARPPAPDPDGDRRGVPAVSPYRPALHLAWPLAWPRWTARLRLTLWYGGLFLLAGLVLVATSYLLVRQRLLPTGTGVAGTVVSTPTGDVICTQPGSCQKLPPGAAGVRSDPSLGSDPNQGFYITGGQVAALKSSFLADALRTFLRTMLGVLALTALLSLGLGWLVAGRVLHPLQRITATAKRLSERTLHQRIALDGPDDELKELADTFDGLLGRLDAAFDAQRRFAANASHELRTPLAISRTEVEVALADPGTPNAELRAMAERVRDATDRSERLIEGLLTLARSEQQPRLREPADLADAAAGALEHTRSQPGVAGLHLTTRLGPALVAGDPALLGRMVANLVENAVRHNQPDGWLEVATGTRDGRALVWVANGGRPIPGDQVESLFEPFRRLHGRVASAARGAGLGLSIVRSVARAHGGDARARALPDGGLEVVVWLPVRARATATIPAPLLAASTSPH